MNCENRCLRTHWSLKLPQRSQEIPGKHTSLRRRSRAAAQESAIYQGQLCGRWKCLACSIVAKNYPKTPISTISRLLFPCQRAWAWSSTYRPLPCLFLPVARVLGAPRPFASSSAASFLAFSLDSSSTVREAAHLRISLSVFLARFCTGLSQALLASYRADPVLMSVLGSVGTQIGL